MINLYWTMADGSTHTDYNVHPASQSEPVRVPDGAVTVTVYLGIR